MQLGDSFCLKNQRAIINPTGHIGDTGTWYSFIKAKYFDDTLPSVDETNF